MREWLSGRASPCQGERREFESRLPLQTKEKQKSVSLFCFIAYKLLTSVVFFDNIIKSLVPWPSGKAKVCKTFIPRFKSGWYLHFPPCVDFFYNKKTPSDARGFFVKDNTSMVLKTICCFLLRSLLNVSLKMFLIH